MGANPEIFVRGIDVVIKRDLDKHKDILLSTNQALTAYRTSLSYLIKRKKYFTSNVDNLDYDNGAMTRAIGMLRTDIRAMSDKVKLSQEEVAHHTLIVDTLTQQLEDYYKALSERG